MTKSKVKVYKFMYGWGGKTIPAARGITNTLTITVTFSWGNRYIFWLTTPFGFCLFGLTTDVHGVFETSVFYLRFLQKNQPSSISLWIRPQKLGPGSISRPTLGTRIHVSQVRGIMFVLFDEETNSPILDILFIVNQRVHHHSLIYIRFGW